MQRVRVSESERAYFGRAADEVRRAPQDFYTIDTEMRPDGLSIIRFADRTSSRWLEVPADWI